MSKNYHGMVRVGKDGILYDAYDEEEEQVETRKPVKIGSFVLHPGAKKKHKPREFAPKRDKYFSTR